MQQPLEDKYLKRKTTNPPKDPAKGSHENSGSPDKPGGLSIQLCKSEKKEFYIRYSS